jgi:uncharacterized protein (DUF1015 family)
MVALRPFHALRPRPDAASRVASVPYDVVDAGEARALAAGNPDSFLRVVRPEIALAPDADPHGEEVYRAGAAALASLVDRGVLARDPEPSLYLYRLEWRGRVQTGVVGCCAVDDYDAGLIRKHEHTRPDKERDRARHALALSAHAGPVLIAYRGREEIDRRVAAAAAGTEPLYDFTAVDGVHHTVWRLAGAAAEGLAAEFAAVPALYIADGHHRTAAYSRARAAWREAARSGPGGAGDLGVDQEVDREVDHFLAALFPADRLTILPYNRVVRDLAGMTPDELLARVGEAMEVVPGAVPEPPGRGRFALYLAGRWVALAAPRERVEDPDPVASLDAAILQELVLGPILGVDDPRTSERIEFVGGARGAAELARRVDARGDGAGFALHPVTVEQLMAVADAGRTLPPKSTWFEPKLRSGLLVHPFEPAPAAAATALAAGAAR